jgi:hypothetical protein
MDTYRYEAEGTFNGRKVTHRGVVYDTTAFEAAEQADEEVRALYPGIVLKGDNPATGGTESPKVFVTRDIVNRIVAGSKRDENTGALLREELPAEFKVGPAVTTITNERGKTIISPPVPASPPPKPLGFFRRIFRWFTRNKS